MGKGVINSLTENYEFQRVYKKGTPFYGRYTVVYRFDNKKNEKLKLGITATKKIGKANKRNRARRLIFECFRLMYPNMKTKCDVVIVAKTSITDVCFKNLFDEILWLTKKAGFYDE